MSDPIANASPAWRLPSTSARASNCSNAARDGGAEPATPSPRNQRWMLAAACVVLLIAGVAGVWAIAGRDEPDPVAGPVDGAPGDGTEFRVVAREPVGEPDTRSLRAAGTPDELDALLQPYGADVVVEASAIDLESEVAFVIVRNGNSCPDDLARFEPTGDDWVAVWEDQGGDCDDVGLSWVYVVALERAAAHGHPVVRRPCRAAGSPGVARASRANAGSWDDTDGHADDAGRRKHCPRLRGRHAANGHRSRARHRDRDARAPPGCRGRRDITRSVRRAVVCVGHG